MEKDKFTLRMDAYTLKRFKKFAIDENVPLNQIIEIAVLNYINSVENANSELKESFKE